MNITVTPHDVTPRQSRSRIRASRILVLIVPGGYTYGQVASLLGVPAGTIKTRMRDALIRLRDCLGVAQ